MRVCASPSLASEGEKKKKKRKKKGRKKREGSGPIRLLP